jgi:hypothetical protein
MARIAQLSLRARRTRRGRRRRLQEPCSLGRAARRGGFRTHAGADDAARQAAACARLQELCRAQHAAARSAEGAAAAAAAAQRAETARVEALVASVQRKCAPGPRARAFLEIGCVVGLG